MNIFRLLRNFELMERVAATKGIVTRFVVSLLRSRYFIIAASFYLLLALILAPIAVSHYQAVHGNFTPEDLIFVRPPADQKAPPIQDTRQKDIPGKSPAAKDNVEGAAKNTLADSIRAGTKAAFNALLTGNKTTPYTQPYVPDVAPTIGAIDDKIEMDMRATMVAAERERLKRVKDFQSVWKVSGIVPGSGPGSSPGSGKGVIAKFRIFQAKYQDGDWNCNPNALYNMMLQIRAWSQNRIDAQVVPEVLDIGTGELFTIKPPFVYLTGHKDFHLLESEVKNLRDYLNVGGAIWADSALAGRRSRFDIAFRREMKRVLPDRDFEIVPENHEIFNIFFENIGLPSGMNYYHEPVEMINIGGKLAVLYTLNGYGHFWEARLNREGKIEWGRVNLAPRGKKPVWSHVYGPHLGSREGNIIYRNMTDETTRNAYKLGINVVVHLLTRYQRDILLLPKELPTSPDMRNRTSHALVTNVDENATNAPAAEESTDKTSKPGVRHITTTRSDRNIKKP